MIVRYTNGKTDVQRPFTPVSALNFDPGCNVTSIELDAEDFRTIKRYAASPDRLETATLLAALVRIAQHFRN